MAAETFWSYQEDCDRLRNRSERCREAAGLCFTWLEGQTNQTNVCGSIREDLCKQEELRSREPPVTGADWEVAGLLAPSHRARLVGWMREVSYALGLHASTTFAAVALMDRFVAVIKVPPPEGLLPLQVPPPEGLLPLQVLACMSVAVKYHEVCKVAAGVWLNLAVDPTGRLLYQAQDLQRMEWTLLQTLGWQLQVPTTHTFLQHFLTCLARASPTPGANCYLHPCRSSAAKPASPPVCTPVNSSTLAGEDVPWNSPRGLISSFDSMGIFSEKAQAGVAPAMHSISEPMPLTASNVVVAVATSRHSNAGCAPTSDPRTCPGCGGACCCSSTQPLTRPGSSSREVSFGGRCGNALWGWPASHQALKSLANGFAEESLMYGMFLAYDYSTIALACVALAEQVLRQTDPTVVAGGPGVASTISAACGLSSESLAPGLERCILDLGKRCRAAVARCPDRFSWIAGEGRPEADESLPVD